MANRLILPHPRTCAVAMGLLAVPSAGLSVAATGSFQPRAKETLFRCIERSNLATLSAIVVQKGSKTCPTDVQIKIEQDRGRRKETILQPLSNQGHQFLNDGKKLWHHNPDKDQMVVQPAPPSVREGLRERMELAEDNYRFEIARNGQIAGRPTWVVTAVPRAPELPARRYSIDVENDVLLRLETVENGRRTLKFDTQAIWYPGSLDSDTFNLKPIGKTITIALPGPETIESPAMARAKAGFEPLMPKNLPFGFIIRDSQLTGKAEARFVAVRITDGLIQATIYQWDPKRANPFGGESLSQTRTVRGISIGLVGDLPDVVHHKMLELFVSEAAKVFGPSSGPAQPPSPSKRLPKVRGNGGGVSDGDGTQEDDGSQTQVDEALMETVASFLTMLRTDAELQ